MTAFLFSTAGFINAVFAKTWDDINIVPTFILAPLTYLGGTFFAIDLLPEIWQNISLFNPIAYIVSAFRYGFLGIEEMNIEFSILIITSITFILYIIALSLLSKGTGIKN
tara:strand:- start:438 stop:767 length:330 start_codon:yes stop_codon:yes gene_type:complete